MSKRGKTVCGAVVCRRAQSNATRNTKKKDVSNVYHFRQSAAGCSSQQASETDQKKTMQRCHADHRVLSLCVIFFFTNLYHPFPPCRGWRWWWRRRRDLTHINSINSGRETRSNDMKKWIFKQLTHVKVHAACQGWQLENDTACCLLRVRSIGICTNGRTKWRASVFW